jgi:hypothetical protein
MALGLSTGCANLLLDSGIGTAFDGANDIIEIRDGSRPSSADDAPVGTVLAAFTLVSDSFAAASGGAIVGQTPWVEASADATGVATWFRLKQSTDGGGSSATDVRIDGDVAASGSDLNLSTTSITITDQVTITQFDLSA